MFVKLMLSHSARQDVCEPAEYKINTIEKKKWSAPFPCVYPEITRALTPAGEHKMAYGWEKAKQTFKTNVMLASLRY